MRYTIEQILFDDGTTVDLPEIHSTNGWVMRPPAARTEYEIRTGTNKSFGRGYDGERTADGWYNGLLNRISRDHGHKKIAAIGRTRRGMTPAGVIPHAYGDSIGVYWTDPVFGPVGYAMGISSPSSEGRVTITERLAGLAIARDWPNDLTRDSVSPNFVELIGAQTLNLTVEQVYRRVETFTRNPSDTLAGMLRQKRTQLTPPTLDIDWSLIKDEPRFNSNDGTWGLTIGGNARMWMDRRAPEKVFTEAAASLSKLFAAYQFLGVKVHISYDGMPFGYRGQQDDIKAEVEYVDVKVPSHLGGKDNRHDHSIRFHGAGVNITCGYVKDEEAWIDYEKRHAEDFLKEFSQLADEFKEFEIDMSQETP